MLVKLFEKFLKFIFDWISSFINKKEKNNNYPVRKTNFYTKKNYMTETEKRFYDVFISIVGDSYVVHPQINLASVIKKNGNFKFQSELYRNVDFGIFNKHTHELLLLIEINDETHYKYSRKKRDVGVENLCKEAGYDFIKFWVNQPNDYNYVEQRINNILKKNTTI
jgi:hypothetical protein